ncbi:hypothetical protein NQ318_006009 [Aromia moschata]|uniref:Uncharacterized protein n=1 Tax=Aromia moschata TaxID=1265417 RepID=A0AAV8XZQ5_9CUCU|nr:hypothetical protein NQ318_006009 [Aromia moschata]
MSFESPYRSKLSTAILKLQSSQVMKNLSENGGKKEEEEGNGTTEAGEAEPLGLKNVEGCFLVTIYGTILAATLVIVEYLIYMCKISSKAKIPFQDAFKQELKFYSDFNSNYTVRHPKTGSQELEVKKKSSSKSRTPPLSMSKSYNERDGETTKSRSNGDIKRPISYGFVIPSSAEKLNEIF